MKKLALLAALATTPAFAQDQDPVYQMIDGIGFCLLGQGKADTTIAEMELYDWTAEADAEMGVTNLMPASGATSGVVTNDVGYCRIESSAIGTGDAEMAFDLFMMGGNSGVEVTADGTDADGCMQKTLSNGAVAVLNSGGQDPVCEGEGTSAWTITFAAG
ncbi:MAG: hypothetical protein JNK34_09380 [Tabrizicola sp.]|nr:hypothetical protein [Tabrizicola sp.]